MLLPFSNKPSSSVSPGASWTEIEIDFGSTPTTGGDFTITDASSAVASKITIVPSGKAATGRIGNDFSWESFTFSALPAVGSFVLTAICGNGFLVGKRNVQYTIA